MFDLRTKELADVINENRRLDKELAEAREIIKDLVLADIDSNTDFGKDAIRKARDYLSRLVAVSTDAMARDF
jgi:hypothetical protein